MFNEELIKRKRKLLITALAKLHVEELTQMAESFTVGGNKLVSAKTLWEHLSQEYPIASEPAQQIAIQFDKEVSKILNQE